MNKKTSMLLAASLLALPASAQKITATQEVVNCGQVIFRHPVTAEFELKNDGTQPLVIHRIQKSCGCMDIAYPQTSIPAGSTFTVKATYDAKQMGTFMKRLLVYSNASEEPYMLSMGGKVVERTTDFTGTYSAMLGDIKTDAVELEFDNVNRGDRPVQRIHIFNPTEQTVEPVVMHLPSYLQAQVSPSKLASHHAGEIILMLDSKKIHDFGLTQTSIYLGDHPGDVVSAEKEIAVSAVLLPDFDRLTATQKAAAPKIQLSTTTLDLGSFGNKKKLKGVIEITNNGKSELDIRSMQVFTMGLQVSLGKTKIKAGDTVKMKVTAVAADLKKARVKKPRILMITNDPEQSKVVINVVAK